MKEENSKIYPKNLIVIMFNLVIGQNFKVTAGYFSVLNDANLKHRYCPISLSLFVISYLNAPILSH